MVIYGYDYDIYILIVIPNKILWFIEVMVHRSYVYTYYIYGYIWLCYIYIILIAIPNKIQG